MAIIDVEMPRRSGRKIKDATSRISWLVPHLVLNLQQLIRRTIGRFDDVSNGQ